MEDVHHRSQSWTEFGQAGTSGGTFGSIQAVAVPGQQIAGMLMCWSFLRADIGTMAGDYNLNIDVAGTIIGTRRVMAATEASQTIHSSISATYLVAPASPVTVRLDGATVAGGVNITTYAAGVSNRMDVLFVPNPYAV